MRWFSKNKRDKLGEARPKVDASSPQRPLKCTISPDGWVICPGCGSESAKKASEVHRWMQEQELDALICPRCGTFLTLS